MWGSVLFFFSQSCFEYLWSFWFHASSSSGTLFIPVFLVPPHKGFCFCCCSSIWNIPLSILILFNFLCLYEIRWNSYQPQSRGPLWGTFLRSLRVPSGSDRWSVSEMSTSCVFSLGFTGKHCLSGRLAWSLGARARGRSMLPFSYPQWPSPPCQG